MRSRPSKYRAKPQVVDGIRFHSQAEARRFCELKLLEKAGEIQSLYLQPRYALHAGDTEQEIGVYVADFSYTERRTGRVIVEDVKGFKTALYKWKKKHVEKQYGIRIVEIQ